MKNHYKKTQLSWSKRLLDQLYNFNDNSDRNLFLTNPELDFLAYLVLRSRNQPNQLINFKRSEILDDVYDGKISGKNLTKVFTTFKVKRSGDVYKFKYPAIFLYNRLKKGMHDRNYHHVPYKAIPIETWLKIREQDNKFTRRLALYILFISNDFPVGIEKLRYRIGMYERKSKYKGRDIRLIQESLEHLSKIGLIQDYRMVDNKVLIQFKGVLSFDQLSGQVHNPKLNHKQALIEDANKSAQVNKALCQELNQDKQQASCEEGKEVIEKNSSLKPEFNYSSNLDFNPSDNFVDMDDFLRDEL